MSRYRLEIDSHMIYTVTMSKHGKLYNNPRWHSRRKDQLTAEPFCRMCNRLACIADHIEPHRGDVDKFYNSPLQSLCKPCHDSHKQRAEKRGYDSNVDSSGWPVDDRHPANRIMK